MKTQIRAGRIPTAVLVLMLVAPDDREVAVSAGAPRAEQGSPSCHTDTVLVSEGSLQLGEDVTIDRWLTLPELGGKKALHLGTIRFQKTNGITSAKLRVRTKNWAYVDYRLRVRALDQSGKLVGEANTVLFVRPTGGAWRTVLVRFQGTPLESERTLTLELRRSGDLDRARTFALKVEKFRFIEERYWNRGDPALRGLEWGAADEKASCRLRVKQRVWREGETPVVFADVSLIGSRDLAFTRCPRHFRLELAGTWYSWRGEPDGLYWPLTRGQNYHESIFIPLDGQWHKDGTPLAVPDGQHTVSMAFVPEPLDDPSRPVRAVSAPVEIFCGNDAAERYDRLQRDGQRMLKAMADANSSWLIGPPQPVRTYAYEFVYWDKKSAQVKVATASKVPDWSRQGITFRTVLHSAVRAPSRAIVTGIEREGENVRLKYVLTQAAKVEIANGLRGRYKSYSLHHASKGNVLIASKNHVPVKTNDRPDWEVRFLDYVSLGEGRYAPTRIRLRKKDTTSDWRFHVYEPGLWLFDRGSSRHGLIGALLRHAKVRVRNVRVNEGAAVFR